jgi:hypothetical protein
MLGSAEREGNGTWPDDRTPASQGIIEKAHGGAKLT